MNTKPCPLSESNLLIFGTDSKVGDTLELARVGILCPHLDSAIVSTSGKSFHCELLQLFLFSSEIDALRLQEARLNSRSPAQGVNCRIVSGELDRIIPYLLLRQIL